MIGWRSGHLCRAADRTRAMAMVSRPLTGLTLPLIRSSSRRAIVSSQAVSISACSASFISPFVAFMHPSLSRSATDVNACARDTGCGGAARTSRPAMVTAAASGSTACGEWLANRPSSAHPYGSRRAPP